MNIKTINRESGDKGKGSRLQRLRAIKLLLDNISEKENIAVYIATEFLDDVYQQTVKADGSVKILSEGDKNYNPTASFSFHSEEVKNTLVGFIDCWIAHHMSSNLNFCFYTNVNYVKEHSIKEIKVKRPKGSIIKQLINKDYSDTYLLPYVKAVLIREYQKQYSSRKDDGYLHIVENWGDPIWTEFLERINWKFEDDDDKQLQVSLLEQINKSNPYSFSIEGKEKQILNALENELERKQERTDFFSRTMTISELKTIYLEFAKDVYKNCDPVYELWDELPKPTDKRNISMKIKAVCDTYKEKDLGRLARMVCEAKLELSKVDSKERRAYQYRAFDASERRLEELKENHHSNALTSNEISNWIDYLVEYSNQKLDERRKDYTYVFTNKETLKNAILELFDSCYLAFDEEGDINGE